MELHEAPEMYEKVIHYDEEKEVQVRLIVSSFRGIEYLHLRKYYLDFNNSRELFVGLTEILSLAESKEIIEEQFQDLINNLYLK